MTEFYKLVFDLSLYYTLSGYYLLLTAHAQPSAVGFLALCCAAALDAVLRARAQRYCTLRFFPLLLPLSMLLFSPALAQILQLLPAWCYLAWSVLSSRVSLRYDEFRAHFGFGLKLLALLIFGPLLSPQFSGALLRSIPYLVLMLACGVCMLRMLREERREGVRQGLYLGAFVLLCAGLTLGKAPKYLVKALGLVYRHVLAPLIFVLAIAFAAFFYVFYLVMKWMVERAQGSREPLQIELQDAAEMLGLEEQYAAYTVNLDWLRTLLIILGIAALLYFLFRIFRRLLGRRAASAPASPYVERRTVLYAPRRAPAAQRFRPRNPREAVRWYYAKFLAECRARGLQVLPGMTAAELAERSALLFPGADPRQLTEIYTPVRYQLSRFVASSDVQRAAEAWSALKRSKAPDRLAAGKQKNSRKSP